MKTNFKKYNINEMIISDNNKINKKEICLASGLESVAFESFKPSHFAVAFVSKLRKTHMLTRFATSANRACLATWSILDFNKTSNNYKISLSSSLFLILIFIEGNLGEPSSLLIWTVGSDITDIIRLTVDNLIEHIINFKVKGEPLTLSKVQSTDDIKNFLNTRANPPIRLSVEEVEKAFNINIDEDYIKNRQGRFSRILDPARGMAQDAHQFTMHDSHKNKVLSLLARKKTLVKYEYASMNDIIDVYWKSLYNNLKINVNDFKGQKIELSWFERWSLEQGLKNGSKVPNNTNIIFGIDKIILFKGLMWAGIGMVALGVVGLGAAGVLVPLFA